MIRTTLMATVAAGAALLATTSAAAQSDDEKETFGGSANLSPDGKTIAFSWDVTGQPELWVMPATGGQPKQITFKTGVRAPIWTPDGEMMFFSADRDGNEQPGYFA